MAACAYVQPTKEKLDEAKTTEAAARLAKMHDAWGPGLNSPNASISLKEISRAGGVVKYRLYAKGLPRERKYALIAWPVTSLAPTENMQGVTLDDSGQAVCAGKPGTCGTPETLDDPIDLALLPVKGEPFRVALVSSGEEKLKAFLKIVPIPNEATDGGCVLEAVLLMPGAEAVEIEGRGFQPNAAIAVESNSAGEHHNGKAKADADGVYRTLFLPYVKGQERGTTHVRIKAARCSPAVTFDWGKRSP